LKEAAMPDFQLSLAPSRLNQVINPWSLSLGSLFTVNLGNAGDTELEQRLLNEVGSYGRQIGQIGDAVGVLVSLVDRSKLTDEQKGALEKLDDQLKLVALIKEQRRLEKKLGVTTSTPAAVSAN
jgi:hypothetical protein